MEGVVIKVRGVPLCCFYSQDLEVLDNTWPVVGMDKVDRKVGKSTSTGTYAGVRSPVNSGIPIDNFGALSNMMLWVLGRQVHHTTTKFKRAP